MTSWFQGNFVTAIRGNYELLRAVISLLLLVWLFAYQFTIIGPGELFTVNLRIDYQKIQLLGIGLVSLVSVVMLIVVGSIPFIGATIPNLVFRIYGDQVRKTIGVTVLADSLLLVFCDLVACVLTFPYEISVSAIVGIIGGATFFCLLIRGRRYA